MNQKGFTLIEMMIVLMVISVLIMITIPNVTKHQAVIGKKGCDAYMNMVQAQVEAYKMDNENTIPSILKLETSGYIPKTNCPNGDELLVDVDGTVRVIE
ncbi:competence type IV pilus major pilin ComGC [Bacillus salitolerans]|uniref:ComG operon protein 3 n=1 Tax=Bacillus salitolerans TaxID=1437434 RepID=A0ABW4LR38_9BACI